MPYFVLLNSTIKNKMYHELQKEGLSFIASNGMNNDNVVVFEGLNVSTSVFTYRYKMIPQVKAGVRLEILKIVRFFFCYCLQYQYSLKLGACPWIVIKFNHCVVRAYCEQ